MDQLATALQTRIGKKMTALRKEMGYTSHEQFAYEHGFNREHYRRLERGETNFELRTLVKILVIHKITIEQFFADLPK